jgi:hypothetical protein
MNGVLARAARKKTQAANIKKGSLPPSALEFPPSIQALARPD